MTRYGVDLWGPFNNWEVEQAAFLTLWKCMPEHAWLHPDESPFSRDSDQWQHTDVSRPFDFSNCLTQTSDSQQAPARDWAPHVRAHLMTVFDRQLAGSDCRSRGPADCVLLLHFWSELDAADPRLAAHLLRLRRANTQPLDDENVGPEHDPEDTASAIREATRLRAELRSLLAAPRAWPADEAGTLLFRMQSVRQRYPQLVQSLERNTVLDPWRVLKAHQWLLTDIESDIYAQMDELLAVGACAHFRKWFDYLPPPEGFRYLLHSLKDSGETMLACTTPEWDWLRTRAPDDTQGIQPALLEYLESSASPPLRDRIMSALLGGGDDCFATGDDPPTLAGWLQEWCRSRVHEPTAVSPKLANTGLVLDSDHSFLRLHEAIGHSPHDDEDPDQRAWLMALLHGMPDSARRRFSDYLRSLQGEGRRVQDVQVWRHPAHSRALIVLTLSDDDMSRRYLLLGPTRLQAISLPDRLRYGVSNATWYELAVMRVSDLDGDGDLEVWHGPEDLDRCRGDEDDLQLDLDCRAISPELQMGEIHGELLTWFTDDRGRPPPAGEQWRVGGGLAFPVPAGSEWGDWRPWDQRCNRMLVASWLSGHGVSADEFVDLACVKHPTRSDHVIVALFLRGPMAGNTYGVETFRRIVAVVNEKKGAPVQLQSRNIEADASMRIDSYTLSLDIGDYTLAPGVRAFGLRMNIGYSPRYAEGGESGYFSLFVEEGEQLREVLSDFALSDWNLSDGSTCWDQSGEEDICIVESRERRLVVANAEHQGWRDLDILTTVNRRNSYAAGEGQDGPEQATGTLRYVDGSYRPMRQ